MQYIKEFRIENLHIKVFNSRQKLGLVAAQDVAGQINKLLKIKKELNIVFAAAPSQNEFLAEFVKMEDIAWQKINAFHMDEYLGIDAAAEQSFGQFLRSSLFSKVPFKNIHYINPAYENAIEECRRYSSLLKQNPPDIVCLGIGENGHLAFNDPPVADFNDPELVKIVELDAVCRQQQVNDGCFASLNEVPLKAITLTIPAMLAAKYLSCVVPGPTKATAVQHTLENDINTQCPATILRQQDNAILYLDTDSAEKIDFGDKH